MSERTRDFHDTPDWKALYRGLIEDPLNAVRRLVIADWLDDFGTDDAAARAKVIRICNTDEWRRAADEGLPTPAYLVAEMLAAVTPDGCSDDTVPCAAEARTSVAGRWAARETGEHRDWLDRAEFSATGFFDELPGGFAESRTASGDRLVAFDPFLGVGTLPATRVDRRHVGVHVYQPFGSGHWHVRPYPDWGLAPLAGAAEERPGYMGVAEWVYRSRHRALAAYDRAMIDRARELADMPPLAWPELPPDVASADLFTTAAEAA